MVYASVKVAIGETSRGLAFGPTFYLSRYSCLYLLISIGYLGGCSNWESRWTFLKVPASSNPENEILLRCWFSGSFLADIITDIRYKDYFIECLFNCSINTFIS